LDSNTEEAFNTKGDSTRYMGSERLRFKPYALNLPRNLDLVPVLSLQSTLDPKAEVGYLEAMVSVKPSDVGISPLHKQMSTSLGGIIKQDDIDRRVTKIEYGQLEPLNFVRFSQREILDDVIKSIPVKEEVPEVVLRQRLIIDDVPKEVENYQPFSGSQEIYHLQIARANHIHKIQKAFGLKQLQNPFSLIKQELCGNNIVGRKDPVFKRMKSVLKTESVMPDRLINDRRRNERLYFYMLPLHRGLSQKRWWQDIGKPHPLTGRIDHRIVEAQVYLLDRRNALVAV
jgi:hypothetical protein